MKVLKAKTAGFCFGVRRAVEMVTEQSRNGRLPVYTYGPIIHNDQVVRELEQKGVRVLDDLEQLKEIREGTLIIRSHGVSRREQQIMEESGLTIVDATCPFVKKIHRIAEQAGRDGRTLVIAGDPSHPEVKGIIGWASGRAEVIDSPESAKELQLSEKKRLYWRHRPHFMPANLKILLKY